MDMIIWKKMLPSTMYTANAQHVTSTICINKKVRKKKKKNQGPSLLIIFFYMNKKLLRRSLKGPFHYSRYSQIDQNETDNGPDGPDVPDNASDLHPISLIFFNLREIGLKFDRFFFNFAGKVVKIFVPDSIRFNQA